MTLDSSETPFAKTPFSWSLINSEKLQIGIGIGQFSVIGFLGPRNYRSVNSDYLRGIANR